MLFTSQVEKAFVTCNVFEILPFCIPILDNLPKVFQQFVTLTFTLFSLAYLKLNFITCSGLQLYSRQQIITEFLLELGCGESNAYKSCWCSTACRTSLRGMQCVSLYSLLVPFSLPARKVPQVCEHGVQTVYRRAGPPLRSDSVRG